MKKKPLKKSQLDVGCMFPLFNKVSIGTLLNKFNLILFNKWSDTNTEMLNVHFYYI